MKTLKRRKPDPDMRDEYDFSGGVRGKYASRFAKGSLVVVLDPDMARRFPTLKRSTRHCGLWLKSLTLVRVARRGSKRSK